MSVSVQDRSERQVPRSVTIYQDEQYVAVCVVRSGGTPEWFVSTWTTDGLVAALASEAEEIATRLLS